MIDNGMHGIVDTAKMVGTASIVNSAGMLDTANAEA
jgi:hypothetical protein